MNALFSGIRRFFVSIVRRIVALWKRYRALRPRYQIIIGVVVIAAFIGLIILTSGKSADTSTSYERTVTLQSIATLSGGAGSGSVLGTVRSVTEADLLAQTGGTVRSVNVKIGSAVGAGSVLGELENASERAEVLRAEGAYDAAIAANTVTVKDVTTDIRSEYQKAFTDLDTAFEVQIDSVFHDATETTPGIVEIAGFDKAQDFINRRRDIGYSLTAWRKNLPQAGTESPDALLTEMETDLATASTFVVDLARSVNASNSGATSAQVSSISTARDTITSLSSTIAALRNSYEAQQTAGASGTTSATEAGVKQALGSLRIAQANLEKTVIRAPIAGTVNFLPIRVGDYVTAFTHVATVAQNGALEIVAYVSEDERASLSAGETVTIEDTQAGVITSIAPALDPVTKQIEIHVAVTGTDDSTLVNGQSVHISFPTTATTTEAAGPILLPLSAVKLYADSRVVFTVSEEGRLVAQPVEIGDVRGDRIEILSPLSPDLRIVTDARGLAEGEKVKLSTSP